MDHNDPDTGLPHPRLTREQLTAYGDADIATRDYEEDHLVRPFPAGPDDPLD